MKKMLTDKERRYDQYVTDGGSDQCFKNGMWGKCGFDCTVFGCKEECFDGATDEHLIAAYRDGIQEDAIYSHFDSNDKLNLLSEVIAND